MPMATDLDMKTAIRMGATLEPERLESEQVRADALMLATLSTGMHP
jgi:hypothetical protein